jgi:hypothetical protein
VFGRSIHHLVKKSSNHIYISKFFHIVLLTLVNIISKLKQDDPEAAAETSIIVGMSTSYHLKFNGNAS